MQTRPKKFLAHGKQLGAGLLIAMVGSFAQAGSHGHTHKITRLKVADLQKPSRAQKAVATAVSAALPVLPTGEAPRTIQMKFLVVSADGTEPVFGAIKAVLNQIGVPYDVVIAKNGSFNAQTLSDGKGAGNYQGIVLTTGNLGYLAPSGNYESAFTPEQWQALWNYEAAYKVRQATLYTFPGGFPDTYGLTLQAGADTTATPIKASLTTAGQGVFNYLNAANPLKIANAWTYLGKPVGTTNPVPLLTTPEGYAIASVYSYADGRMNLAVTADGNENAGHTLALGYGIVNWLAKGTFLGERKAYMTVQPDDLLLANDMWDPVRKTAEGAEFRISGTDLNRFAVWQRNFRARHPLAANLTLEIPFNGLGASGMYPKDTLTPAVRQLQSEFNWISHTYTHAYLDTISLADAKVELSKNNQMATSLGLKKYTTSAMVQPNISGLNNPAFLQAAAEQKIRYILSDTSQPGWNNPSPNAGYYSAYQPSVLIIPRRPTNLYFNVSTPAEWVSEYNHFYAPGGLFPAWDRALTYAEILDKESDLMLSYLAKFDLDPLMFHQPNMRAYDGVNSLLGDLLHATLTKYEAIYKLPVVNGTQEEIGKLMAERMVYNGSGVKGTLVLGSPNRIVLNSPKEVVVPMTGIASGTGVVNYGGQQISKIKVTAGASVTLPGPTW
jgi:hypothetical protein